MGEHIDGGSNLSPIDKQTRKFYRKDKFDNCSGTYSQEMTLVRSTNDYEGLAGHIIMGRPILTTGATAHSIHLRVNY